jgi:hypothetical protein
MAKTKDCKRLMKDHTDKYIHIPRWVSYLFSPIYIPIILAIAFCAICLDFVMKIIFTLIFFIFGLFGVKEFMMISYKPDLPKYFKLFGILVWWKNVEEM